MLKIKPLELIQIIMFSICGTSVLLQNDKPMWLGLLVYSLLLVNLAIILFCQKYRN